MVDLFFDEQPNRTFESDLREYEVPIIKRVEPEKNQVYVSGVNLVKGEFDCAELDTVYDNLYRFLCKNNLTDKTYKLSLVKEERFDKEEYQLDIRNDECIVKAGDIEAIRRAIIHIEDLLLMGGGNLTLGNSKHKAVVKRRLARCFFAPINRPPRNKAELDDDVDYYPDAYLDRLMRDGANAIWVYADLDHLVKSEYIVEFGEGSEKRIAKLNSIIKKCAKYGIKVYLFFIAPMSLEEGTIANRYKGIAQKYPEVRGNSSRGPAGFCVYSEFGEKYLYDAIKNLVENLPGLGGLISITLGERVTSCGNTWPDLEGVWKSNCPHCKDKSRMQIVTHTSEIIKSAIDSVDSNVDFISWTYGMRGQSDETIREYVKYSPKNVIMLQNFEDDGRVMQLGKKRFALDYYLSYAGPSDMFKITATDAVEQGKEIYAKLQICCSHEIASVPYIPVPGLIYEKMNGLKALGVTGIMESWLFGNYPCLMSKAVGLLYRDNGEYAKREFLAQLASIYWKNSDVEKVVSAWEYFEKGYTDYPVNVMFNYYGPMHDGVVWELSLIPKNLPLSRSWQLIDRPNGDRIGECLFSGHTLEEAITLSQNLVDNWQKGLMELSLTTEWANDENEQVSVAKALGVLFESGLNVLKFYKLRDDLGYGRENAKCILDNMRKIVLAEIENSEKMISLCEKDNRLGYHSEAEGYKFFPEKLRFRIKSLLALLDVEFTAVQKRIENGEVALSYYLGDDKATSLTASRRGLGSAEWAHLDDNLSKFRIAVGDYIEIELYSSEKQDFCLSNEFRLTFPEPAIVVKRDGTLKFFINSAHQSMLDEKADAELEKWQVEDLSKKDDSHFILRVKKEQTNFIRLPYKLLVRTYSDARWCVDEKPCYTLGKDIFSPGDFGWIK